MDSIVDALNTAYLEYVAAAAAALEAKELSGGQNTAATDVALENFKQRWELFRVACDRSEEFIESVKQRIGSECLVDEATGSATAKPGQSAAPGLPPISAVRLEQMSKAVRWLVIELQQGSGTASSSSLSHPSAPFDARFSEDPTQTLPESLLREDDVFYETIKSFVQRGVNGNKEEKEQEALGKNIPPLNMPNDKRNLSSLLDYMTNECLCSVVDILTHGSVDFEKIRWKMIKVIKDYLRKMTLSPNDDLFEKLSPLLKDPRSFRRIPVKFLDSSSQSYEASVLNILDGLDELPTCALLAMHRKVSGIGGYIPQVRPLKHGWKRDKLIGFLRKTCIEMLSAGEGDDSRESLNKAMGVAALALKLIPGNQYVTDLTQFSPDLQVVQIEIAKAIWFLNRRVRFPELKKLQLLIDPGSKLSKRNSRSAIRKLLTEYLFECSDMDSIPGWLLEALAVINQKSRSASLQYFSKEDMEKEVECILSLGAHTKQIVWDLSIEHEFDYDFADSYMEDSEESDDGEYSDNDYVKNEPPDTIRFGSGERHDPSESITESISANFTTEPHDSQGFCSPHAKNRTYKAELDSMQFICISTVDSAGAFSLSSLKTKKTETESACVSPHSFNGHSVMKKEPKNYSESNISCRDTSDKKIINQNPYLAIQGASDVTSLFVYRLIGRLIEEFAQSEGLSLDLDYLAYLTSGEAKQQNEDQVAKEKSYCNKDGYGSVIFQTVQQLWSSFSQSGKNKLEEMMSLSWLSSAIFEALLDTANDIT